jgi:thymidylate synthase (FAD)
MKLCKPLFEIWEQSAGLEGVYKQIEKVGRVCYKSEDKITEDSAKLFVDRMIKSGHNAMLEHGTVYLKFLWDGKTCELCNQTLPCKLLDKYCINKYSIVNYNGNDIYITTNFRVLVENGWLDDLQYICEPTKYHERRVTVHFVCDRGVSHEFVRHRVMSFAQESTRYCNYSKDKFGNELTFIKPCWFGSSLIDDTGHWDANTFYRMPTQSVEESAFLGTLLSAEKSYFNLLKCGWKPQEARAVLPNSLKTELVVTGFTSDWNHFFDLRARGTTGAPHPQAKELAEPLMKEFITRNYIDN